MENKNFAVFILTFGRAKNVKTYNTLKKQGYTGKIYFICSDDDEQLSEYIKRYGNDVFIFNKKDTLKYTDDGINDNYYKAVIYARNYSFLLAKELELKTFLMLDDDYNDFYFSYNNNGEYKQKKIKNLNKIFDIFVKYLLKANLDCVAFIQKGEIIGGKENNYIKKHKMKRKIMNTFFINVNKPFKFYGKINEDTTCYVLEGLRGKIFFTCPDIVLDQTTTQKNKGGLTDIYLDVGTYIKTFYSVMYCPSAVKISILNTTNKRIHHKVNYNSCCPVILRETTKK